MAEILSDGVRSVTSDDTSARDYSGMNRGYGYGEGFGSLAFHQSEWQNEQVRDLLAAVGRSELASEKLGAATSLAIEKVGNQGRTDALTFANQGAVERMTHFNATQVAIEKVSAANALSAAVNTAAIQASIAECCCELKELVRDQVGSVLDRISADRIRSLELQLLSTQPAVKA